MQIKFFAVLFFVSVLFLSCQPEVTEPETVGPDPVPWRIERDSIQTGSYLDIAIGDEAATVYPKIQALQASKGLTFLNVVSNVFSDLTPLRERIPLYQYILLDQSKGTDSGVQITIEGEVVKVIYLNNGQKLSQWPEKQKASSSVRVGDPVSALYEKFQNIRDIKNYASKFERISLLTKNLATPYDNGMSQSPQWYFGYSTGQDTMDQIQVHFAAGKVVQINIDHYSKY